MGEVDYHALKDQDVEAGTAYLIQTPILTTPPEKSGFYTSVFCTI